MAHTEIGALLKEIGWSTRELAARWRCHERTARYWANWQPGGKNQPPDSLLPRLRAIAAAVRNNAPPDDWYEEIRHRQECQNLLPDEKRRVQAVATALRETYGRD